MLKKGDKNLQVKDLQNKLVILGYNVEVDGIFGNNTFEKVVEFQKNNHLIADGIVGEKTSKLLDIKITSIRNCYSFSDKGVKLVTSFEGCVLKTYLCSAGVPTIGYGHTKDVNMGDVITEEEAILLLKQDLKWCVEVINKHVTADLTQNQVDALISFVFNLGETNFSNSTLLDRINANDDKEVVCKEFLRWNKVRSKNEKGEVVYIPSRGLTRRREAEAELFKTR